MSKTTADQPQTILTEGQNCWRIAKANRASFLIDACDYFYNFRESCKLATNTIIIIGWDINSQLTLLREGDHTGSLDECDDGLPNSLGAFLNALVEQKPQLRIYVLNWDYAFLYADGREHFTKLKMSWNAHKRIQFELDGKHPTGASKHQKIVAIDNRLAFVGGIDFTLGRWDTQQHKAHDKRRKEIKHSAQPFHDIQIAVDGKVARSIFELAVDRWYEVTGETISKEESQEDPWPESMPVEARDISVGISRTYPAFEDKKEIREIEHLILGAICKAKNYIYLENQYFSAECISNAVKKRLEEKDGPEVIIILPLETDGWLSQVTMDVLRERLLKQLIEADHEKRLRVYFPDYDAKGDKPINVHSKITIVDDRFLRVGSANYNNRSLGLDTECDLAIEAIEDESSTIESIKHFKYRLVSEHLDVRHESFEKTCSERTSLIKSIELMQGNQRTLKKLPFRVTQELDELVPEQRYVDPEKPVEPEKLLKEIMSMPHHQNIIQRFGSIIALLLFVLALALSWQYTPLSQWLNVNFIVDVSEQFRGVWYGSLIVIGAFVVLGLLAFPCTILATVSIILFGPLFGSIYSLAGAAASAATSYGIGLFLGKNKVQRWSGPRINQMSRQLKKRGIWAVIFVRIVPVAPFTVINLIAGAIHIRLRDLIAGTVLGMTPGILSIALFTDRILAMAKDPSLGMLVLLLVVIAFVALVSWRLNIYVKKRINDQKEKPTSE